MRRLERLLKILTPYGGPEKDFRFLKEAKILSEFFHSKLHAQCNLRQAKGGHQKLRLLLEAKKFRPRTIRHALAKNNFFRVPLGTDPATILFLYTEDPTTQ